MVKALKGDPINGYFYHTIAGVRRRFDQNNVGEFVDRIPHGLATNIARQQVGRASLVPIPNSHVTSVKTPNFKTFELAKKVAAKSNGELTAVPALVFQVPQIKSREGGPRSPDHFEDAYTLATRVKGTIILLDDVCTGGGHLIGAFWKLHSPPDRNVVLACTFGRTTSEHVKEPIALEEKFLDVSRFEDDFDDDVF
jgi:hypothetical protein